jgi:diaminopimelate epimerase
MPDAPHAPVQVWKYHALGNDYVVVADTAPPDPAQVRRLCDRHRGVGGDGVLFAEPFRGEPFGLRIFNPDGSEAERSGNGLRIFARFLRDEGRAGKDGCVIRIPAGDVRTRFLGEDVEVDMGAPDFRAGSVPFLGAARSREVVGHPLNLGGERLTVTALSLGNPHCVLILPETSEALARRWGPLLENHRLFPRRVNVEFVQVVDDGALQVHLWERGAGFTQSSGSGATASAAAARRLGLVGDAVRVVMPGGTLAVRFGPDGRAALTGPAQRSFRAVFDDPGGGRP